VKASTRIPDLGNANVGIFKKTLAIPQKGIAYFFIFYDPTKKRIIEKNNKT